MLRRLRHPHVVSFQAICLTGNGLAALACAAAGRRCRCSCWGLPSLCALPMQHAGHAGQHAASLRLAPPDRPRTSAALPRPCRLCLPPQRSAASC